MRRYRTTGLIMLTLLTMMACSSSSSKSGDATTQDGVTSDQNVNVKDQSTTDTVVPVDLKLEDQPGVDQPTPTDLSLEDQAIQDTAKLKDLALEDQAPPKDQPPPKDQSPPQDLAPGDTNTAGLFNCQGVTPVQGTPKLALQEIETGLGDITDLAFAPGDTSRLFVVLRPGQVLIIKNGTLMDNHTFLDLHKPTDYISFSSANSNGERGLLSIVFHPNFAQNKLFYVYYTNNSGDVEVVEYKEGSTPDVADPASRRLLMKIDQTAGNHNGGSLHFSPKDGYLYISVGDGGGSGDDTNQPLGNGQATDVWLGKILRIDVDAKDANKEYKVPTDNPFVGNIAYKPEIFHLGLRNPYRASFDALTGDYWIGDVGQNSAEEISLAKHGQKGLNFGWRCKEADTVYYTRDAFKDNNELKTHCEGVLGSLVDPVIPIPQSNGFLSVMGGYVYRGCKMPGYRGHYFYGDYFENNIYRYTATMTKPISEGKINDFTIDSLTSWAQDHQGELYLGTLKGNVYKLVPSN